jgi:hypothetical protein
MRGPSVPVSVALISLHIGWLHFFVSLSVPLAFKQQPPCILHMQQKGDFSIQSEEPKIKLLGQKFITIENEQV